MLFLLTDTPQKRELEKIHGKKLWKNSLLCKFEFSSASKTSFSIKITKTTTLQQVTGGNTPNIVLTIKLLSKRYFLKNPPLKKILQFQEIICFY